jgi:hypothetical protein
MTVRWAVIPDQLLGKRLAKHVPAATENGYNTRMNGVAYAVRADELCKIEIRDNQLIVS